MTNLTVLGIGLLLVYLALTNKVQGFMKALTA